MRAPGAETPTPTLGPASQTVRKWIPKWQENQDPSGRANAAHLQADIEISKKNVTI